jgi:hypothetical protein
MRSAFLIVSISGMVILASGCHGKRPTPVETKPVETGQGQTNAGNRVQAVFYPSPPAHPKLEPPEQGTAPPVTIGPFIRGTDPSTPGTKGSQQPAKRAFSGDGTNAPAPDAPAPFRNALFLQGGGAGAFQFYRNNGISLPSASFSTVDEPSVGARTDGARKAVLYTGNWYAGVSMDAGSSFSYMNPATVFPASAGGFCCDQRAIYEPSRDLFFWLLQYSTTGGCTPAAGCTGNNIYRVAVANGAAGLASGNWCYYDFSPQSLGLPAGLQFDYPHVALSNGFFYFSANSYLTSGLAGTNWRQSSIVRIPLDPLTSCAGYTYNYLNVNDHYDFNLAHGATNTMYWASISNTSSVRIYSWAESSGTIFFGDHNVTSWNVGGTPCPDPNGVDWCSRSGNGGRSGTGWINAQQQQGSGRGPANTATVGFMWNAQACTNPQGCGYTRPWSYVRVLRFNSSDLGLIDEPDIWNGSYAFQFPSVGVNGRRHVGGTMFWGGGSNFPTLVSLIWDDLSCNPYVCGWENYGAVGSSASNAGWGDYLDTRPHSPYSNTWVATGYSYDGTNVTPQFLWFGRQRDTPP